MRMGHPSFLLKHMYSHLFKDIVFEKLICKACQLGKFKRIVYLESNNRAIKPFTLIHCDVWDPSPRTDICGYRWFLICTDDFSRYSWLFLLKTKDEVPKSIFFFFEKESRSPKTATRHTRRDKSDKTNKGLSCPLPPLAHTCANHAPTNLSTS